jgi:hypothetical protein
MGGLYESRLNLTAHATAAQVGAAVIFPTTRGAENVHGMSDSGQRARNADGMNLPTSRSRSNPIAADENYVFHDTVNTDVRPTHSAFEPRQTRMQHLHENDYFSRGLSR